MMGRAAMMRRAAVVWRAVSVHWGDLVALLVLVGSGVFGVHDAVFQVHVVDCICGWVETVHAVGHG